LAAVIKQTDGRTSWSYLRREAGTVWLFRLKFRRVSPPGCWRQRTAPFCDEAPHLPPRTVTPIPTTAGYRRKLGKQESCAIAKITARCALYMSVLEVFECA